MTKLFLNLFFFHCCNVSPPYHDLKSPRIFLIQGLSKLKIFVRYSLPIPYKIHNTLLRNLPSVPNLESLNPVRMQNVEHGIFPTLKISQHSFKVITSGIFSYITTCEDCGSVIHYENAHYDDDEDLPYCERCYAKLKSRSIRLFKLNQTKSKGCTSSLHS